jgi:hypothetical protein
MPSKRLWLPLIAGACAALAGLPSAAAPMRLSLYRPCEGNGAMCAEKILATGDIEPDSARKLLEFVRSRPFQQTATQTPTIAFDSDGGNVGGAMTLGRLIRRLGADNYFASRYASRAGLDVANGIRNVSFTTWLSTENLPAGAALLLRMQ